MQAACHVKCPRLRLALLHARMMSRLEKVFLPVGLTPSRVTICIGTGINWRQTASHGATRHVIKENGATIWQIISFVLIGNHEEDDYLYAW